MLVYFNLVSDARRFARELPRTLRLLTKTDPDLVPGVDRSCSSPTASTPPPGAPTSLLPSPPTTPRASPTPLWSPKVPHRERPGRPLLKAEEDDNAEHRKVCAGWNMSSVG